MGCNLVGGRSAHALSRSWSFCDQRSNVEHVCTCPECGCSVATGTVWARFVTKIVRTTPTIMITAKPKICPRREECDVWADWTECVLTSFNNVDMAMPPIIHRYSDFCRCTAVCAKAQTNDLSKNDNGELRRVFGLVNEPESGLGSSIGPGLRQVKRLWSDA